MPAIYSWGANTHGQLGQGNITEQCATLSLVKSYKIHNNAQNSVIKIIGGGSHSFLLEESGNIYGCGANTSGQLGIGKSYKQLSEFKLIATMKDHFITDIVCGWDSTVALTQMNIALVWGSNKFLQLGLENKEFYFTPQILQDSVKFISMGLRHLAIVYDSGLLATAGSNNKGQLGLCDSAGDPVRESTLQIVLGLGHVLKVACGQNHTLVLTADGELFGFGDNRYKQICANNPNSKVIVPQKIYLCDSISRDSYILCGWTHNAIYNNDGKAILWGRNNYGQLTGTASGPLLLNNIKSLALGSEHCLSIDINNILYSWGWNEHNNCGVENAESVTQQTSLANDCILIGCGYGYGFAILLH